MPQNRPDLATTSSTINRLPRAPQDAKPRSKNRKRTQLFNTNAFRSYPKTISVSTRVFSPRQAPKIALKQILSSLQLMSVILQRKTWPGHQWPRNKINRLGGGHRISRIRSSREIMLRLREVTSHIRVIVTITGEETSSKVGVIVGMLRMEIMHSGWALFRPGSAEIRLKITYWAVSMSSLSALSLSIIRLRALLEGLRCEGKEVRCWSIELRGLWCRPRTAIIQTTISSVEPCRTDSKCPK